MERETRTRTVDPERRQTNGRDAAHTHSTLTPTFFRSLSHMHTHTHTHAYTHTHTSGTECWQSSCRNTAHHHHDSARHGAPRNPAKFQISESSNADRAPLAAPHLSRTGFQKKTCCKHTHTHANTHIHVRTHTHTYAYTYTHTHTTA